MEKEYKGNLKINNQDYEYLINFKKIKNYNIRLIKDCFIISAPRSTYYKGINNILKELETIFLKLIKRMNKKRKLEEEFSDNYIYLFGNKYKYVSNYIYYNGNKILFLNKKEFYLNISKYVYDNLNRRFLYYKNLMKIEDDYKLKLKLVKSIYGSINYKSKSITLNLILIHYDYSIIDSVIVHELAHHYVNNHQKEFYKVIYKYLPSYDLLDYKLRHHIYK